MSNKRNDSSKGIIKTFYVSRYRKSFIEAVEKFIEEKNIAFSDIIIEALFFYFYSKYNLTVQERELFKHCRQATRDPRPAFRRGCRREAGKTCGRGLLSGVHKKMAGDLFFPRLECRLSRAPVPF